MAIVTPPIALGLVIAGLACAPVAHQRDELSKISPCCTSLRELPFSPLPADTFVDIELTGSSPAFAFPSGASYFVAFSLPPTPVGVLGFRVKAKGATSITETTFCPSVLFLDQTFDTVGDVDADMTFVYPKGALRGYFSSIVQVPPAALYLVIYSTKPLRDETAPIPRLDYISNRMTPSTIACANTGTFRVFAATPADTAG